MCWIGVSRDFWQISETQGQKNRYKKQVYPLTNQSLHVVWRSRSSAYNWPLTPDTSNLCPPNKFNQLLSSCLKFSPNGSPIESIWRGENSRPNLSVIFFQTLNLEVFYSKCSCSLCLGSCLDSWGTAYNDKSLIGQHNNFSYKSFPTQQTLRDKCAIGHLSIFTLALLNNICCDFIIKRTK